MADAHVAPANGRLLALAAACLVLQACDCKPGAHTGVSLAGDTSVASFIVETTGVTVMLGDTVGLEAQARSMVRGDGCFVGGPLGPSSSQAPVLYRWQSTVPTTVEVDDTGRLAARELGGARVQVGAIQGGATNSIAVRVVPRIVRLTISPRTATVLVGDTVSFLITALDADGRALARVPFVEGPDPALVWHRDFRDYVGNQIRAVPERVLLRALRAATVPLVIRSFISGIGRVPQDTALLVIRAP